MQRLCLVLGACLASACDPSDSGDDDADPTAGDESEGGSEASSGEGTTGGSDADSGEMPSSDSSSPACGIYTLEGDPCTDCTIENCCDESEACAADNMCMTCFGLFTSDILEAYAMGCEQYAPFAALRGCVNDPGGCGPICNPSPICGNYSCFTHTDCLNVGCSSCNPSGRCE